MRCGVLSLRYLLCSLFLAFFVSAGAGHGHAGTRYAFVIGVGDYGEKSGIQSLVAPVNDAEKIKNALERPGIDFQVELVKNADVASKAEFEKHFSAFLDRIQPGDDVLFYFSGHGFNIQDKGNYFLLSDSKTQNVFSKGAPGPAGESSAVATRRWHDWLASVALSENDILDAIIKRQPRVVLIIADACRTFLSDIKGTTQEVVGIVKPKETQHGVFRLYSARAGQVSFDAPSASRESPERESRGRRGEGKGEEKKSTSLFTTELLREISVPQEISILAAKVRLNVRDRALDINAQQVPDFSDSSDTAGGVVKFFFIQAAERMQDNDARCRTAKSELVSLGYGVGHGSFSALDLEKKRIELAPCGLAEDIERLMRLQEQGGGQISTRLLSVEITQPGNLRSCDDLASSPLDANRLPGTGSHDIQKVALTALSKVTERPAAIAEINRAIDTCKSASAERGRVARLKYNLGRAYYALASVSNSSARKEALKQASVSFTEAVDLGYAAAYNSLASLYQNGEYYGGEGDNLTRQSADVEHAAELLQRGADLGDVLAEYSLGMAYLNGYLRFPADKGTGAGEAYLQGIRALAFKWLSKAAESGYVPAMVETAKMLYCGCGVERNRTRALELLEISSSRGSWDAMYQLGYYYEYESAHKLSDGIQDEEVAKSRALLWYARAAEAGDARSQKTLARWLTDGDGLPAPQPEAAARYWRLAAGQGDIEAQVQLAGLLRNGKLPFRPNPATYNKKPDGGAQEIFNLYSTAFARGEPLAGYQLASLFRTGFPAPGGSEAIPRSAERAVNYYWETMDRVKQADPDSEEADPEYYFLSAFELIKMYDANEAKRADGTSLMLQDQIDQLRQEFGDPGKLVWVHPYRFGNINCNGKTMNWVAVWDSTAKEPPTEAQFNWWERRNKCRLKKIVENENDNSRRYRRRQEKNEEQGIPESVRSVFKREYESWLKRIEESKKGAEGQGEKKPPEPYSDRIVKLVAGISSR